MAEVEGAGDPDSVYARLGGAAAVRALVDRFYALMDERPAAAGIRRLHPADLRPSADNLYKFLSGWFGGPPLYVREKGHPRMRMRHAPFAIGPAERDQWLACMRQALHEQVADPPLRAAIERAFVGMAEHMVNRVDPARSETGT
jgi:hemoglobin